MVGHYPATFGKYVLLKRLARGGMGEIFLAVSGEMGGLEKLCVIKRVSASQQIESAVRRFLDEAKVVIKLSHGNLVQVFDAGYVDSEAYLAMEYVEGNDLRNMLMHCHKQGLAIPLEMALYLIDQVCRGLAYAHSYENLNLVHRDICPSNVLVSYSGEVKVTDFGLAKSSLKQEWTEPGKIFGKFSYLAPEQARREEVDTRTDLYSAAIILWELLTGKQMRPGPHTDIKVALHQIRLGKIVPPSKHNPGLPQAVDALVIKGLQVNKEHRYASAEEMRRAIAIELAAINPSFGASDAATFLRSIYQAEIDAVRLEREQLLAQTREHPKREGSNKPQTPSTSMVPRSGSIVGAQNLAGQIVDGRYRIIRLIGEGGMGGVYEAEHIEIGRRVALKILHAIFSSHAETVARFRAEARAASCIGHPNIIEVTDSGTTEDGRVFFVMELLEGFDLAAVMAEQRIVPFQRALAITRQLCLALHAAHEAGIVHRDLKPENIFLTRRNGQVDFLKILDFGIAKNLSLQSNEDRLTHPGIAMGTPEYMAPEQAVGLDVDRRIDIYATGALLFEMLTGRLPHEGKNMMQMLNFKTSKPPTPPRKYRRDIPESLEKVILRSLAADRRQRFQTMHAFAEALNPFIKNPTGSIPAVMGSEPSEPPPLPPPALPGAGPPDPDHGRSAQPHHPPTLHEDPTAEQSSPPPLPEMAMAATARGTSTPVVVRAMTDVSSSRRRWNVRLLALGGGSLVLLFLLIVILWPSTPGHTPAQSDAAVILDIQPIRLPDAGRTIKPAPPPQPKLTAQEVERLLEWSKRAAMGGRYIKPKGDNVQELLLRIEHDHPGHPGVVAIRALAVQRIKRSVERLIRRHRYNAAEAAIEAWTAFVEDASEPQRQHLRLLLLQGKQALSRRHFKAALQLAKMACKEAPKSAAPEELWGDIYWQRRKYALALRHYEKAMAAEQITPGQKRRLKVKLKRVKKKVR